MTMIKFYEVKIVKISFSLCQNCLIAFNVCKEISFVSQCIASANDCTILNIVLAIILCDGQCLVNKKA